MENLYTIERYQLFSHLTQAIIQKIGKICILTIDSNNAWTGVTQGAVLLTLPEKFRPVEYVVSSVVQLGTHENANVQILTNGQVIYRGIQSIKGALYFNVVYFTA